MRIALYFDEDSMDKRIVSGLRARGIDVLTAYEAGQVPRGDEEHLEFATSQDRVLFSFNIKDFYAIHSNWLKNGRSHAGIVVAKQQHFRVGEQLRRFLHLTATLQPQAMID